ncbi:hypothetical protein StoSoilB13_35270 (plasmid) [Arthrobacter sp. StoSoilB13]|nr:hypothetical protein StoSoilB13_35270 [Arthrobacter sp. StoSoilB13]
MNRADAGVVRALLLCLVLELRHAAGFTHSGDAVQYPRKLGMLGDLRLHEQRALLHVHAAGYVLGSRNPGAAGELGRILRNGDGVQIRNEEDGVVLVLHANPVDQSAKVVAKVQGISRGLHT